MKSFTLSLLLTFSLQLISLSPVFSEKVVLDLQSDHPEKWLEISCLYSEDYNDFYVFGYPVSLIGDDDVYPDKRGFWIPGHYQRCELHYFGGRLMPVAKSITIGLYLKGTPQILVTSKEKPLIGSYTEEIGNVTKLDGSGWFETTIDVNNPRALVFNFTLLSMPGDLLLLDTIVFDLGDDTTSPRPIGDDNSVLLDTSEDYWTFWEENCNYVNDYTDYWAYGCPAEPKQDNFEVGFWNPCSQTKSCAIRFKGSLALLPNTPTYIQVYNYIDGNARISVTIQGNHDDLLCREDCAFSRQITCSYPPVWRETLIEHEFLAENYTINIELIPSTGGLVLADKILLRQSPSDGTTTTTTPPEVTTETEPEPTPTTPYPECPTTPEPEPCDCCDRCSQTQHTREIHHHHYYYSDSHRR